MRFAQTTNSASWTRATLDAISLMKKNGIFSVVLETPEDAWCLGAILMADDKLAVEEEGVAVAKPLILATTSFCPGTSTLTVTGTIEETRASLCEASPTTEEFQLALFPGLSVTVERRTGDPTRKASWTEACERIRTATLPDRRSEALAVVLLERDGSRATLRVLEGEQLRLDKTIHTADFKDDVIIDMPKMAVKPADRPGCSARSEKPCKASKMARSVKARMAPLQGNLYAAVVASLLRFVDLDNSEHGCPLLIASLGEAGRSFQQFLVAEATTKQNAPLLHMASVAIVVDTYGAASQAEPCEIGLTPRGTAASKPKTASKKLANHTTASAGPAAPASSVVESAFRSAFEANLWMPAQRKKRDKKSMCAFDEMMMRLDVLNRIHNVRFSKAADLLRDVQNCIRQEREASSRGCRAVYGVKTVEKAVKEGAVCVGGGALLVNKSLFYNSKLRDTVAALTVSVREQRGAVHILSDSQECGQRLANLGGIAALLTFPLFDLDDDEGQADEDCSKIGGKMKKLELGEERSKISKSSRARK
ncbi:Translation factor pelota [Sporothrix epigloea]|uniref:Translation factor pelota n=1 Tax=Sporothrix epigloea TaxID=1892477 RepID=A0ABP0D6U7_9PEZI